MKEQVKPKKSKLKVKLLELLKLTKDLHPKIRQEHEAFIESASRPQLRKYAKTYIENVKKNKIVKKQ